MVFNYIIKSYKAIRILDTGDIFNKNKRYQKSFSNSYSWIVKVLIMKFRYYIYNILEKTVLGEVKDLEEGRFIVEGLNPRTSKNYVILRKRK